MPAAHPAVVIAMLSLMRVVCTSESGGEGQASERASSAGGGRLSQTSDGRQGLSNEKLKSILSFLDEVETKDKLDSIDQVRVDG